MTTLLSTYFAGLLTSLTPCVYPLIPLSLGYLGSRGESLQKKTIIAFSLGQVLMFSLMGFIAVQLGEVFGFLSENNYVQIVTGVLMAVFAYFSWKQELPSFLNKLSSLGSGTREKPTSLLSAVTAGFLSALVASPCSTPVLAGVLILISKSDSILKGVFLMSLYGLGLSTLFLVLGFGILKTKQLPKSGMWMTKVHTLSVILLAGSSIYFLGKGFSLWG